MVFLNGKTRQKKEDRKKQRVCSSSSNFYLFIFYIGLHLTKCFLWALLADGSAKQIQGILVEKCFIWEAKTSLKGGIKESAKVFPEDDRMKVILRHGEVCVKEEALEEVNETKQSTCRCMSTQRAKKALDSTS